MMVAASSTHLDKTQCHDTLEMVAQKCDDLNGLASVHQLCTCSHVSTHQVHFHDQEFHDADQCEDEDPPDAHDNHGHFDMDTDLCTVMNASHAASHHAHCP